MKSGIFLCLFILSACSTVTGRGPASVGNGRSSCDLDPKKSTAKAFPPQIEGKSFRKHFYLELKDSNGQYLDCEEKEVLLLRGNKKLPFKFERGLPGRYYVTLEGSADSIGGKLSLMVRNTFLIKEAELFLKKVDRSKSKIRVLKSERTGMKMELVLRDGGGKPLDLPSSPEIILDGLGETENLKRVGQGTWEFDLVFPNINTVIYISVRAHGAFLDSIYRVQYIEK